MAPASDCVAQLNDVRLSYGKTVALAGIRLEVPAQRMVGLIGPGAFFGVSMCSHEV